MKLNKVFEGVEYRLLQGELEQEIREVQYDSRKVQEGDLFVAVVGFQTDGHKFVPSAIEKGARVVVISNDLEEYKEGITYIKVENSRRILSILSSNYYGKPSKQMKIIGITGTNGKTTSTFMLKKILEKAGKKVGLVGTIANYIGDKKLEAKRTTPESLELHKLFKEMLDAGVEYCVMEVSSHSLNLDRVYGVEFEYGLFTNLSQDHLDFHKTFEEYFDAKCLLFKSSNKVITNIDDKYGKAVLGVAPKDTITYSIDNKADIFATDIKLHSRGVEFKLNGKDELSLLIPGKYNVYNALCCIGVALGEEISIDSIREGLKEAIVPGRCENVTQGYELGFEVIVDYAHTPDGLENILNTAKEFAEREVIAVFGCGGDRDKGKRPIMGEIGARIADKAIITSDNPRSEEPMSIINDILSGIKTDNYVVQESRYDAIKEAMKIAQKGDVIVIAGKGHEDYQVLKDETIHFDEREVVAEIIKESF